MALIEEMGFTKWYRYVYNSMRVCFHDRGWINNYGYTHLYYNPTVARTRCNWIRACLICDKRDSIEKDPDERLMPHRWEIAKGNPSVDPTMCDLVAHELFCEAGCGALWDPVPEGKDKLL